MHTSHRTEVYPGCYRLERPPVVLAQRVLRDTFVVALKAGAQSVVPTPGWRDKVSKLSDVVTDEFAGSQGDEHLHELLAIVQQAADGGDVQLRAQAWIARMAGVYSAYHADDYAAEDDR